MGGKVPSLSRRRRNSLAASAAKLSPGSAGTLSLRSRNSLFLHRLLHRQQISSQRYAAISSTPCVDFVRRKPDFVSFTAAEGLFPIGWDIVFPCSIGNDIHASGMDDIRLRRTILPVLGNDILAALGQKESPAELSFCGACLPWQLSTLAGPVVRLPSTC